VDLVKRLQPLRFHHLFEWFPGASFEGALAVYAATGGVPRYLEFFQRCTLEEVRRVMLNPDTLPFRDAKLILEEELPEPRRYFLVLEAIASGRTRLGEIAQYSGLEPYKLTYYLGVLRDLGYVTYERPLLEGKRGVYRIADPYLAFWFRFIHPFYEELESGITAQALAYFERNFNTHLGQVFEQVAGELLLPELRFTRAGRWWKRGEEIDLVALDEDSGTAYFVEFKYSREVDAELEARRLRRKAELFGWRRGARREVYVIVARSFSRSSGEAVVIDERKLAELALRALEREASATGLSAR
jgi:AAA+ ATPase superfamily predicted ATPase